MNKFNECYCGSSDHEHHLSGGCDLPATFDVHYKGTPSDYVLGHCASCAMLKGDDIDGAVPIYPEPKSVNYKEYLASREWALLKEHVRQRSHGWCERCAVGLYEQTHHVTYERVGRELLTDLLAVCRECHEFLSAKSTKDPSENVRLLVVAVSTDSYHGLAHKIQSVGRQVRTLGHPRGVVFQKKWVSKMPSWAEDSSKYRMSD